MEDDPRDRRQDEKLIGRQIELDARETTGAGSDWPPVAQLALTGDRATGIFEDVEFLQLFWKLDAGLFVDPFSDVTENTRQEVALDLRGIGERKVEVLFGVADSTPIGTLTL